ncbi:hypothetical protein [Mesorhizobium sp.]|nr:hypothetical protein [Mesorhizobium sp.]
MTVEHVENGPEFSRRDLVGTAVAVSGEELRQLPVSNADWQVSGARRY